MQFCQNAEKPTPTPLTKSCFSDVSTGYIKSNKWIMKIWTISFNLIPNSLCLTGGATKTVLRCLGSWTILKKHEMPSRSLKESLSENSEKISDCQALAHLTLLNLFF